VKSKVINLIAFCLAIELKWHEMSSAMQIKNGIKIKAAPLCSSTPLKISIDVFT